MGADIRVRFAPSPTGYLHVGGARTALFNYLFARRFGGTFILRIEDTDRSRYQPGALKEIFEGLRWLGLEWDEGPEAGGGHGPYVQSERKHIYEQHVKILLESAHAYPCFCPPERLDQVRREREKAKAPTGYDRRCRSLSKEQQESLVAAGTPYVVRLKVPDGRTIAFDDAVRGRIEYSSDVLDDLVLLKSDGFPTYHLANVVDDHLMNISHVLRGDEWIASTPRHVLLYEAFGWGVPVFAHLPVILSPDGAKLSKRKGAASVMDYRRAGYLPEALFNFLVLLGWSPGDDREKMAREEIVAAFSLAKVSPKSSVFDEKKLEWMNGLYMQQRSIDSLLPDILASWHERGMIAAGTEIDTSYLTRVVSLMKDRSKRVTDLVESTGYFFTDPRQYEEKAAKSHFTAEAMAVLTALVEKIGGVEPFTGPRLEEVFRQYAEEAGVKLGKLVHPTRLAVSGVSSGPGLFDLLETLGKETVLRRMGTAVQWIEQNRDRPHYP